MRVRCTSSSRWYTRRSDTSMRTCPMRTSVLGGAIRWVRRSSAATRATSTRMLNGLGR
ncbi:Uncharacterised protein [Mycobacteroides abscessus subsp. abscessus]|nr:Uncharacterised protein [Mycobacteroides abscessus subsp. abscessus]